MGQAALDRMYLDGIRTQMYGGISYGADLRISKGLN